MTGWLEALTPSGCLAPRARVDSDAAVLDLAGTWDFSYTPRRGADPEPWTTIEVPGCWQTQGHGAPVYLSAQFPFALDPPHLPDENALGTYRRVVDVPDGFARAVLRCDGIDATAEISVDGVVLGWTKGSRLSQELPVSLAAGPHEITLRVSQFSATSYVEDQDMFWLSGIFRDICLVARPHGGIDDVRVVADYDPVTGHGLLEVEVASESSVTVTVDGRQVALGCSDMGAVEPWTAESPRLYELVLTSAAETVTMRIGFRRVEISGGLLRVNGRPIRFRGVNRHDTDPDHGRTVTRDSVREDLLAMKRAHINAVRTSHYPPLPYMLDLADELGLYVLEEGDIETHAFVLDEWRHNPSDDPAWRDAYIDRTERMVMRDRHHPSVILWSLGNEAGAGANFLAARDWLRAVDPTRPIHYERDPSFAPSDVVSVMYPEPELLERMVAGEEGPTDKPIVLCEYAHAMGAGPGGLTEYEALIEANPRIQGGFVWEWRDHTLRLPTGRLGYGGDFGEPLHDGAFAADGLHHGDGTPKPGLDDYAAVIAPVRVAVAHAWDAFTVSNAYDHVDLSHAVLVWRVDAAAGTVVEGSLELPEIVPGGSATVPLPAARHRAAGRVLTVAAVSREDTPWAQAGQPLGIGQSAIGLETGDLLPASVGFHDAQFTPLGDLSHLGGLAVAGPAVGLWRAPTDNDFGMAMRSRGQVADEEQWREANLAHLSRRTGAVIRGADCLSAETWTAPYSRSFGVHSLLRWRPIVGGVELTADIDPFGQWPCPWARCGLDWTLPGMGLDTVVAWQGLGPGRGGADVGQATRWGWFSGTVADWQVPHARPQDDGLRGGVTRLSLGTGDGRHLVVTSYRPVWVSLRPWTDAELALANHPDELPRSERLVLGVNAAVHGYGTGACGPGVLEPHRLLARRTSLVLNITIE